MKKLLAILCVTGFTAAGFGQGLVNFFNNANTLVTVVSLPGLSPLPWPPPGTLYFALLTSPIGANTFTFSGVYGTNQSVAGRFNGGVNVPVAGWAAGTSRDFEVAGWSASLGPSFNPAWLTARPIGFGLSDLGTGNAGGLSSSGTLPSLNVFGGASGIQSGFTVFGIPEPRGLSLIGLGLTIFWVRGRNPTMTTPILRRTV